MKYYIAFLVSVLFWVNFSLYGLRIVDFIIILSIPSVLINQSNISKSFRTQFTLYLILVVSSFIIGIFDSFIFEYERIIFLYKYFIIFFLIIIYLNSVEYIDFYHKIFSLSLLVLTSWVYYYNFFFEYSSFKSERVSFPFSNSYELSDAHLYSYVLTVLYAIRCFKKPSKLFIIESTYVLGALLLTGSRYGILLFPIVFFFALFNNSKKKALKKIVVGLIIITLIYTYYLDSLFEYNTIKRSLQINFGGESVSRRFFKIKTGFNQMLHTFPFGNLNISSEIRWFDNGFIQILVSFGILPTILYTIYYFPKVFKFNKYQILSLLILLTSFFSSEFFLTTRGAVVTVFMFCYAKYSNYNTKFQTK